jgi:hypothetical protein
MAAPTFQRRIVTSALPGVDTPLATLRSRILIATLPGVLFGLAFMWQSSWVLNGQRRFTLFDDAMISMSYARTLAQGKGLVWYPDATKVEGFTNPLWTFIMSLLHWLGLSASLISLVIMLIGLACIFVSSLLAARIARQLQPTSTSAPVIAAFCMSLCYPLTFWSLRGMEVGLLLVVALALIASSIDVARDPASNSRAQLTLLLVLTAVGLAIRLDFAVVAISVALWLAWTVPSPQKNRVLIPLGLTVIGSLAAMTIARFWYFGSLVPNTYTLKITGISLVDRIQRGVITDLKLAPVLAIVAVSAIYLWKRFDVKQRQQLVLLVGIAVAVTAYSTYVGGDAWEFMANRYVVPALAVSVILSAATISMVFTQPESPRRVSLAIGLGVIALSSVGLAFSEIVFDGQITFQRYFSSTWLILGFGGLTTFILLSAMMFLIRGKTQRARAVGLTAAALAVTFAFSGIGTYQWLTSGGFAIRSDQLQTERGLAIKDLTAANARIAVSYAGAPIYYSERGGIDLLGKSDSTIAKLPPKGDFYPGHNKWDYTYSISTQLPDVVTEIVRPGDKDFMTLFKVKYSCKEIVSKDSYTGIFVLKASKNTRKGLPASANCFSS